MTIFFQCINNQNLETNYKAKTSLMQSIEKEKVLKITKAQKQEPNCIKVGKYKLKYPQNHRKKKPIHKEIMKQLQDEDKDILDISWGKYKRFKWDKVLKYIKQSDVERISAYGNNDKKMLIELSRVTFHNLTYLDLRECQLQNIETLPSGPHLNFLSLANNNIYTVKSLKKCQLSGLKTLLLNDNPISFLELQRCNFQLQTFWLERKYNTLTIQESLSQTSIFKLKSSSMKDISLQSAKRIYQAATISKVHQKYLNIDRLLYIDPENEDQGQFEFINYLSDSDQGMIPVDDDESEDNIQPPSLFNVQGQNEEDWLSESNNFNENQDQMELNNSDSDESWG